MSPVKYAINVATCGGDGIAPAGGDGQVTVTEGEVEVLHVPACGGPDQFGDAQYAHPANVALGSGLAVGVTLPPPVSIALRCIPT